MFLRSLDRVVKDPAQACRFDQSLIGHDLFCLEKESPPSPKSFDWQGRGASFFKS
jgi:hypothetical protein